MQNIEQTIVELGGIFQQLAHMVKEQEEMVQRYEPQLKTSWTTEREQWSIPPGLQGFAYRLFQN